MYDVFGLSFLILSLYIGIPLLLPMHVPLRIRSTLFGIDLLPNHLLVLGSGIDRKHVRVASL